MPAKSKNVAKDKAKVSRSTKENNAKGKKTLKSFKKRKKHTRVCEKEMGSVREMHNNKVVIIKINKN